MAFAGLKKQINKANQYMTEMMGAAEGTKLDDEFMDMERRTDVTVELVEDLQVKTREFLQPNPTTRARMAAIQGIHANSGAAKAYPQPEGVLGECMQLYGKKLGEESVFAQSLIEMGDSMQRMAESKYALDDNVKQNFLAPLHQLQTKDLKEVMHHRKKLQGRRLDFDCKRRQKARDEEVRQAEEKFAESLHHAHAGMFNLLENDVEQISQLTSFSEALLEYHQQCVETLKSLVSTMREKTEEAANRPKSNFTPKTLADLHVHIDHPDGSPGAAPASGMGLSLSVGDGSAGPKTTPLPSPMKSSPSPTPANNTPHCTAIYDFDPENPGELGFKEGDIIQLVSKMDENWYEGTVNGQTGFFPQTYVEVVVPLP